MVHGTRLEYACCCLLAFSILSIIAGVFPLMSYGAGIIGWRRLLIEILIGDLFVGLPTFLVSRVIGKKLGVWTSFQVTQKDRLN